MNSSITLDQLINAGLTPDDANTLLIKAKTLLEPLTTTEEAWQIISKNLLTSHHPFPVHRLFFTSLFPDWETDPESAPAWLPTKDIMQNANLTSFMSTVGITDVPTFHQWSVTHYQDFWHGITQQLKIIFDQAPEKICDEKQDIESLTWFPDASMNIANSCFNAPQNVAAIIYEDTNRTIKRMTYEELNQFSNRIANSLVKQGFQPGDAIAIAMPMNPQAVAIYLGIIKMGGVVISIADSFSSEEVGTRLKIADAKAIFTQDFILWGNKKLPLYEKIKNNTHSLKIIALACNTILDLPLRENDLSFDDFLVADTQFKAVACDPMSPCNILFSSGTTGIPKAIPWNHTTPIKTASDAYFHQNISSNDILAWPTNLGWMMGPWLIFSALINHATIALYTTGAPKDREFGEFIQNAKVTMLGVVPTLVATWRQSHCMEKLDWSAIKVFTSTGECSNPEDMFYLMSLGGYKPIIEYCGGTEIGGAYLSSTVIEKNYPSLFTTPTMGLDMTIIDEAGNMASQGEVAIIPPSMGLSTTLLNADHHDIYFANMPVMSDGKKLRRHGDQIKQLPHGHYMILGRVDDTMNLGGIKISAAEIERALTGLPEIIEVAAIAVSPPDNGPSLLVIYAATQAVLDKNIIRKEMQAKINLHLNPLFKIHDVIFTSDLPKTASNKIMRRVLRKQYMKERNEN
jgi:acetyl-CoA synthetase